MQPRQLSGPQHLVGTQPSLSEGSPSGQAQVADLRKAMALFEDCRSPSVVPSPLPGRYNATGAGARPSPLRQMFEDAFSTPPFGNSLCLTRHRRHAAGRRQAEIFALPASAVGCHTPWRSPSSTELMCLHRMLRFPAKKAPRAVRLQRWPPGSGQLVIGDWCRKVQCFLPGRQVIRCQHLHTVVVVLVHIAD